MAVFCAATFCAAKFGVFCRSVAIGIVVRLMKQNPFFAHTTLVERLADFFDAIL